MVSVTSLVLLSLCVLLASGDDVQADDESCDRFRHSAYGRKIIIAGVATLITSAAHCGCIAGLTFYSRTRMREQTEITENRVHEIMDSFLVTLVPANLMEKLSDRNKMGHKASSSGEPTNNKQNQPSSETT